ncbi:unnamed protein product [Paramecium primaurelia]|uniref:Tetratricopeptide repeat protein n=1 Tax=Paramecium primaurelia TaxID=5886 RepID=A0A8S1NHB0_PARPR|nr:unnamed protein product [Paramecium primaurelia]
MLNLSIKNIFEFLDKKIDGVKENLLKNIDQLQGLGIPDICIITKQQPLNLIKSSFETLTSFHFVQGLCPQSQADVFAYLLTILQNQEKAKQTLFSKSQNITKVKYISMQLTYLSYDSFSKTILVCEIQLEGEKKQNIFGVQENQKFILPTKYHWKGAYISNILRAIDEDLKLASVGRFFNNINLKNNIKLGQMIYSLLELITINTQFFQNFDKISSNQCLCDFDDILYYICWPLGILVTYLVKSNQLQILINELENIQNNVAFYLIKSIIFYKMKQYQKSLSCLVNITSNYSQLNLIKYLFGKILIKQGKFQQAFLLIQEILINCSENQIIWITLASIFRKQNNYQVCLSLLNKAADLKVMKQRKQTWIEMYLQNYRVLTQDYSITHLDDLDKIYTLINPIEVDQIESFTQLSNYPILEKLLMRLRVQERKELKQWHIQAQKLVNNQAYKIEQYVYDFISQNELLQNKNKLSEFQKEIIKLSIQVGHKQLQKYLQYYFYYPTNCSSSSHDNYNNIDNAFFEIRFKNKSVRKNQNDFAKRQNNNKSVSLNELDSDEEDQPEFLNYILNKSFDFSESVSKKNLQKSNYKQILQNYKISHQKYPKLAINNYQTIQENAFESVESQRDYVYKLKGIRNSIMQNNNIRQNFNDNKTQKVQIYGLIHHLSNNIDQQKQTEIGDIMKRKKDILNPLLKEFIDYISQTQNILDELFYKNNQIINLNQNSQHKSIHNLEKQTSKKKQTQIFISSLKESLKDKNYQQKQIDLRDFYTIYGFQFNEQNEQETYLQFTKQESIFLYNCSKIANKLKQQNLSQKLLQKLSNRIISIQVSYSLLDTYKDDHSQLIQIISKIILDFLECGISKIVSIPIWVEIHLIRLIKLKGCNYVLGLLCTLEDIDTFQLLKKIVLQTENLL